MDLQAVLTSTVVAAVISILANVYNARRAESLKYVTEERQKWREEIRKIAEDIVDCPRDEIKKHLTRLKVRINSNGKIDKKSYIEDGHIWQLIENLENSSFDISEYEKQKEYLIDTLSLLLKFDWERQKREVLGSHIKKMHIIFFTCVLLVTIYIYGIPKEFSSNSISPLYMFSIFCITIPNIIFAVEDTLGELIKKKMAIVFACVVTIIYLLAIIYVFFIYGNIIGILKADNIDEIVKLLAGFMIAISMLDFILSCVYIFSPIHRIYRYNKGVLKVSGIESNSSSGENNACQEEQSSSNIIIRIKRKISNILSQFRR